MLKKTLFILLFLVLSEVLNAQCLTGGTILFKEDFGGNNVSDPIVKSSGLPAGVVSGYTYKTYPSFKSYTIAKTQLSSHCGETSMWRCTGDHTHEGDNTRGYFSFLDGYESSSTYLYRFVIKDLCAGTKLSISFWAVNMHHYHTPISLGITVKDGSDAVTLASHSSPYIYGDELPVWHQIYTTYTMPAGQNSIVVYIVDKYNDDFADDFGIDDIEVRLCAPPVTINLTNISLCAGEPLNVSGSFVNDGTFIAPIAYRWLFSATNDSNIDNWTAVGNTQNLNIANVTTANAGYYRLAVSSSGSINSKNCRAMSDAMQVTIKPAAAKPIIGYN